MSGEKNVVVVGGGLSGLCCARAIQRAGHHAQVFEASDGVGGRVRSDVMEGFTLERGFQVLFTAYPAIKQEMDLDALRPQPFDPGALVWHDDKFHALADPLRKPTKILSSAFSPLFPLSDKMRIGALVAKVGSLTVPEIFALPDQTMDTYLREFGFSDDILERFFRPFFSGIFLEKKMETSARMFAFVFKMLAQGQTALPEKGMGAIPQQLADGLLPGTLHLNSSVTELIRKGDRVTGVRLEDGRTVEADTVVVAAEADAAAKLTGLNLPVKWRVSTDVYFALPERLYREKMLLVFTDPNALINNAVLVNNVVPSYAPEGQHLLSCTILDLPHLSDEELAEGAKAQLAPCFPKADTNSWRLLRVYRIRAAQFAQPAGIWNELPPNQTRIPGLILAGEITSSSSLHGALVAGQKAAGLALSVKNETALAAA